WYLEGRAEELPLWHMMTQTVDTLQQRATAVAQVLRQRVSGPVDIDTAPDFSQIGGGSMPGTHIPSVVVRVTPQDGSVVPRFEQRLRYARMPVIARISHGSVIFDLRTIFPSQESLLIDTIVMALEEALFT
ncbi:MAG: L-seryl-tRNA(Sec) selenium transferase, partial [Sulfobacillus thermotolerans]|nr:L-seryl-tRNA(Sec) selenium transferase [Sulfobacillus thermotolerans]